jgi:NADH dehydrogenase
MATDAGVDLVLQVRPQTAGKTALAQDPRARVFDLSDASALADAMKGADAVVSLVGTMRNRFKEGDTYEASDVLSTEQLVSGAKAAGVPRFLLLSSLGAGGFGAYLKMKGVCEQRVQSSGLRWSIFRPSMLVSPARSAEPTHGKRTAPPGVEGLFHILRAVDQGRWTSRLAPIGIDVLVRAMLRVLSEPRDGEILEGRTLLELGELPSSPGSLRDVPRAGS